ncbi:hypothetical protein SLS61_003145 [Didymella pomorum]
MPSAMKTIVALLLLTAVGALPTPQLAGEGAAADSIFTDTDNAVGYAVKDAEENTAGLVTSIKGGSATTTTGGSGSGSPPPPPPGHKRRQANKICDGFQDLSNAAGTGSATSAAMAACDNVDGELTDGAANAGATVGGTEESTLEGIGKAIPRL